MSLEPVMPPYNASDPSATFLSSSCLDFLLIELVPLAYRVTNERDPSHNSPETKVQPGGEPLSATNRAVSLGSVQHSTGSEARKLDEDEELDAVHLRLDALGYRVGQGLVERQEKRLGPPVHDIRHVDGTRELTWCVKLRFSIARPRFLGTLDVIKFLCKDLWSLVFGKNIDNLKTNHRGVYVLTDNAFRPFSRMSTDAGGQALVRAQPFLWFPCGIVRGALAALGITATVQAEINELPGAVFQIKALNSKS
ncbi:hypothetical protein E4U55_002190 [Claviceps digitariae]|nr:hypothetical protein E4U55_002190 [Claviceps digitariae]